MKTATPSLRTTGAPIHALRDNASRSAQGRRTGVLLALLLLVTALGGCTHVNPSTGLTYMLHTDYAVFNVDEDSTHALSNFIGYCLLPMRDAEDQHAETIRGLVEFYLQSNAYRRTTQAELVAEPLLQKRTFLVGIGYVESFAYETTQLEMTLYYINQDTGKSTAFWSWKAKFDSYPVTRARIEPAFRDLFCRQPMDWGRTETIFPPSAPTTFDREVFFENLAGARLKLRPPLKGTAVEAQKLRGRIKDATALPQKVRGKLRDSLDMEQH